MVNSNEEEIIIKDMDSFMRVKKKLDEHVFWRASDTLAGKVEIKLAINKGFSRKVLSEVKD